MAFASAVWIAATHAPGSNAALAASASAAALDASASAAALDASASAAALDWAAASTAAAALASALAAMRNKAACDLATQRLRREELEVLLELPQLLALGIN